VTPVPHPKLSRTLRDLAASELHRERCAEAPPALLIRGVQEFNDREFFDCHETLEELWRAEPHPIRYLYQGILHVAVGYYHQRRGNHHGAITKLGSGLRLLEFYAPLCQGVEVAKLLQTAGRARERLLELGPDRMDQLEPELVATIQMRSGQEART
jgi:predicted metal-dependent hydrolase